MFQVLKTGYVLLDRTLKKIMHVMANSQALSKVLWLSCDLIKAGFANQAKVEIAVQAVKAMKQIIKWRQAKVQGHVSCNIHNATAMIEKYPAVRKVMQILVPDFE